MLPVAAVSDVILRVAEQHLPGGVLGASVTVISDAERQEALQVTVTIKPAWAGASHVREQLAAKTDIQWELGAAGDGRFAYVRFATEAELADLDG